MNTARHPQDGREAASTKNIGYGDSDIRVCPPRHILSLFAAQTGCQSMKTLRWSQWPIGTVRRCLSIDTCLPMQMQRPATGSGGSSSMQIDARHCSIATVTAARSTFLLLDCPSYLSTRIPPSSPCPSRRDRFISTRVHACPHRFQASSRSRSPPRRLVGACTVTSHRGPLVTCGSHGQSPPRVATDRCSHATASAGSRRLRAGAENRATQQRRR